jgi:hypothetical protein
MIKLFDVNGLNQRRANFCKILIISILQKIFNFSLSNQVHFRTHLAHFRTNSSYK